MRCPACAEVDDKVVDTRVVDEGSAIRRRRECLGCGRRYTTYERLEDLSLSVVKRSGFTEPFDREKIAAGIRAAASDRLPTAQVSALAADIEEALRLDGPEIPSDRVGREVLDRLRSLDEVAYLRFASVYKSFEDLDDFRREVGLLAAEGGEDQSPTT